MIHSIWILLVLYRISTYFLFFKQYFHYNRYSINLIVLHRTAGPYRCLFFDMYNTHVVITINKPRLLSFDYIAYSANVMGQHCVFVIHRHKGKCNSLILILLIFCLSHQKNIQDKTRWLFIIVLHLVKSFVWYQSVLNQYSYYCYFFCLVPTLHLCHHHCHMWLRYFDTTKNMV